MTSDRGGSADGQRGAALVLVLFVLVVAWSASLLVATLLAIEQREERGDARRLRLTALSDSALAEALAELDVDPYSTGLACHRFAHGEICSRISEIGEGVRDVTATARLAGMERVVRARVALAPWGSSIATWRVESFGPARAAPPVPTTQ